MVRCGRHAFRYKQHEQGIRQPDSNTQSYLLASSWRQTEREHAQNVQPEARQQDAENVVQDAAVKDDVYRDVRENSGADWINDLVTYNLVLE